MPTLVTLAVAKDHLRIAPEQSADDADISVKLTQANALVLDYIARPTDADRTAEIASWDIETVPGPVQIAILLMLAHLYEYRGDDPSTDEALWLAVGRVLMRHRDPVLA